MDRGAARLAALLVTGGTRDLNPLYAASERTGCAMFAVATRNLIAFEVVDRGAARLAALLPSYLT